MFELESVRERAEKIAVTSTIACRMLERGEEVYRQYPNGCVYVYRAGKYAHVAKLEGVSLQVIGGPSKVFRFIPPSTGHIQSLKYADKNVSIVSVKFDMMEQKPCNIARP